jgi:uncharacterized protein YndB with AHSA1/START domain
MGHIKYASDVGAPVEIAFTYTDNPAFVPEWMVGIAALEPVGDTGYGAGAVYAATLHFGVWRPTVECEITEYRPNAVIGYTLRRRRPGKVAPAISEVEPATPWGTLTLCFDPLGYGRSVLTSEADWRCPWARRLPGRLCAKLIRPTVQWALRRSESQLRREIEEFHGTDLVGRIA